MCNMRNIIGVILHMYIYMGEKRLSGSLIHFEAPRVPQEF